MIKVPFPTPDGPLMTRGRRAGWSFHGVNDGDGNPTESLLSSAKDEIPLMKPARSSIRIKNIITDIDNTSLVKPMRRATLKSFECSSVPTAEYPCLSKLLSTDKRLENSIEWSWCWEYITTLESLIFSFVSLAFLTLVYWKEPLDRTHSKHFVVNRIVEDICKASRFDQYQQRDRNSCQQQPTTRSGKRTLVHTVGCCCCFLLLVRSLAYLSLAPCTVVSPKKKDRWVTRCRNTSAIFNKNRLQYYCLVVCIEYTVYLCLQQSHQHN